MFLLPAIGALLADCAIIYLHREYKSLLIVIIKVVFCVENTTYIEPLSITRLALLFPLIYRNYSGTRLKFPLIYSTFHAVSWIILSVHLILLSILTERGIPNIDWPSDTGADDLSMWFKVTRVLITLSIGSVTLHAAILLHIRSSAPSSGDFRHTVQGQQDVKKGNKKRKLLAYWVYDKYRRKLHDDGVAHSDRIPESEFYEDSKDEIEPTLSEGYLLESETAVFGDEVSEGYETAFSEELDPHLSQSEPFLSSANEMKTAHEDESIVESVRDTDSTARKRKKKTLQGTRWEHQHGASFQNLAGIQAYFTDGYEFLSEIRTRFQEAKREWGAHLDEVTDRVQQQTGTKNFLSHLNHQTPFQALLHLYAHEEVLTNNKLDRAFSNTEDDLALSFYAPQLLVFLLHNAYLNTGRLEMWLLEKCRTNIQFAHRCFWFLRAWCLKGGVNRYEDDGWEVSSQTTYQYGDEMSFGKKRSYSGGSLSLMIDNDGSSIGDIQRVESVSSIFSNIELISEERQSLKDLLSRVMECGENAARKLEYGHSNDGGSWETPPLESSPLQEDSITSVSPTGLCPSVKHLNTVTAKYTYGIQPFSEPDTRFEPMTADGHTNFLRTPDFLDKLIMIADDLMEQPRKSRTAELRRRLKKLEVECLPSNSIYIPIKDSLHRVWRIVASESIALSTKERVPCIVCLEVVDYSKTKNLGVGNSHKMNGTLDERVLITNWYKLPRPAQRHNTLLSKVSVMTKRRLEKLRHTIQNQDTSSSGIDAAEDELRFLTYSDHTPSSLFHDIENDNTDHNAIEGKNVRNDVENQQYAPLDRPPRPKKKPKQSLNNILSEKENTASIHPSLTETLGQWSSVTQMESPGQDAISDDNKSVDSSTLHKLQLELDDNASQTSVDNNETNQEPPYSSRENYEMGVASTNLKEKESKRRKVIKTTRSPPVVFKEDWQTKEERLRSKSAYGTHPNWRLLPILIKSNDDLRQEQLAAQLIHCMASILAQAKVPVWLYPYEILALTFRGGIIEAIPDTISIDSLRKNHPNYTDLKAFFEQQFGPAGCDEYENAKANFVESLAAYSIVCFLLQVKDRHNGNILLDNKGHLIHIDFGFFFLSSPGKNSGFESAPFKLTRDFVDMMDGANSHTFIKFRELCYKTFLELRKECFKITLLVQMLTAGNEDLDCFHKQPHKAVNGLRDRFRLDLNDRACLEYVNLLVDDSLENWTTTCYDRYQRCCVGVM